MDSLNEIVGTCCKQVQDELSAKGIDDAITCKVKDLGEHKDWLALYRSNSQFRSGPIFWINKKLPKFIKNEEKRSDMSINPYQVACDNIRHEYGHVIAEWGYARNSEISGLIRQYWSNEEEFAEGFKDYLAKNGFEDNEEHYDKIVELFKRDLGD